jgi:ribosomal protein S18 acetylase RimI-like enzyme
MKIKAATTKDMGAVSRLFREYQQWLGIDLCFQGFEEELATLPGRYAPPNGAIFIAIDALEVVGCVGIRPRVEYEAELKRLYVKPSHQGRRIGRQLFDAAMAKAKRIGYTSVVLDTLPMMQAAHALYLAYGFKEIPAYYDNPEEGVQYYRYVFD